MQRIIEEYVFVNVFQIRGKVFFFLPFLCVSVNRDRESERERDRERVQKEKNQKTDVESMNRETHKEREIKREEYLGC